MANKTVQNILDQKRSILINNRIPPVEIQIIKREVAAELGFAVEQPIEESFNNTSVETNNAITNCFEEMYINYFGMDPVSKPKIPKIVQKEQTNDIITEVDNIIKARYAINNTLEDLHSLIYVGAITVITLNGQQARNNTQYQFTENRQPPWQIRLERKIAQLRVNIGRLYQGLRPDASMKTKRQVAQLRIKYKSQWNKTDIEILDLLKQKLAALTARLKRYIEARLRRQQNQDFNNSQRYFFRNLEQNNTYNENDNRTPNPEEVKNFWEDIWSHEVNYKENATWIKESESRTRNIRYMNDHEISKEEVRAAIMNTHSWKAPGMDHLQNFWLKQFKSTHEMLSNLFTEIIRNPEQTPEFLSIGKTILISKTSPTTSDPSQYRPITCLPTMYKLLTSIITTKIYKHLEDNEIMATEQKGCCKGSRGCKEQLVIDAVVSEKAKNKKLDLYTAFIDYKKAFDSVPHKWLLRVLGIYKIDTQLMEFLRHVMNQWETTLTINAKNTRPINVGKVKINRGIYQGDSLSALWFCAALNPLSTILNNSKEGFQLTNSYSINHLMYMDDIKIYASTRTGLNRLLKKTEIFSKDIGMEFGLEKCRISIIKAGKIDNTEQPYPVGENQISLMDPNDVYKYLGYEQAGGILHTRAKTAIITKYHQRLKSVLKTHLSGHNKIKAINTYAIPILTYSFGIINWTQTDLENLNRRTRTCSTTYRCHHPRSAIERFNLPRKQGGRGVLDITAIHANQIHKLRQYFYSKEQIETYKNIIEADVKYTPLKLANRGIDPITNIATALSRTESWMQKTIHGKFPATLKQPFIDSDASNMWLTKSNIFSETEGFMVAIQDGVIATRNYRKHIIKDQSVIDDRCRMCSQTAESIEHIASGCTTLAPTYYTERHNNVAKILHIAICKKYDLLQNMPPYYKYDPLSVMENEHVKLYWDRSIITDRTIPHNRPDIVLNVKAKKITYLIDIAIPLAANIPKQYTDKISKYTPLTHEIKDMWHQTKVMTIPVIIGAYGEIPKSISDSLNKIDIDTKIYIEMQKSVILNTCGIVRTIIGTN